MYFELINQILGGAFALTFGFFITFGAMAFASETRGGRSISQSKVHFILQVCLLPVVSGCLLCMYIFFSKII